MHIIMCTLSGVWKVYISQRTKYTLREHGFLSMYVDTVLHGLLLLLVGAKHMLTVGVLHDDTLLS